MADEALLHKIHSLSDLELAALICLVAEEHCIIDTEPEALDDLVHELSLVSTNPLHYCQAASTDSSPGLYQGLWALLCSH